MGCNSSKLQDLSLHEDYNYRRPVWNENRKSHIESCELESDTCGKNIDRDVYKRSTSQENIVAKEDSVKSRIPENDQSETDLMRDKIDADQNQNTNGEIEDMLNTIQRNTDELIDTLQRNTHQLSTISHNINNDDCEDMVIGIKDNVNGQGIPRIDNIGTKTVSDSAVLKATSSANLISNADEEHETKFKNIENLSHISDTDKENDTVLKGTEEPFGESEFENLETAYINFDKITNEHEGGTTDANMEDTMENTEMPNNSPIKEEPTSVGNANKRIEDTSSESNHDKEPVKDIENETADGMETVKEIRPLTKVESESVSMMYYGKIKTLVDSIKDEDWITDDGSIAEDVCHLIDVLRYSYSGLYQIGALFNHVKEFREKVAKLILESKIADKICEIVVYACKKVPVSKYKKADNDLHVPVHYAMHVLGNFTDTSPELVERIANYPDFLAVQRKIQKDFTDAEFQEAEPVSYDFFQLCPIIPI